MARIPGKQFTSSDIPESNFAPIPEGDYVVMITDSDVKSTKSGDGEYLKLTFKIIEGSYQGRLIWSNLNLVNANETAVEIAQRELAAICSAIGISLEELWDQGDTQILHGTPMLAKVKIQPGRDGYDPSNSISKYRAYEG